MPASGRARRIMVKLTAMLPDWVTMADAALAPAHPVLVGPHGEAGRGR
jgi:hypothetical protein